MKLMGSGMSEEKELCPRCKKNYAKPQHPCPFMADIYNDDDYVCVCCDECTHECAMDV